MRDREGNGARERWQAREREKEDTCVDTPEPIAALSISGCHFCMHVSGWHTKSDAAYLGTHCWGHGVEPWDILNMDAMLHALRILDASATMPLLPIAMLFRGVSAVS